MKPTLHQIATMRFPESIGAIRKYYDPLWGKLPEPDGELRPFKFEIEWEVTEHGTFATTVQARSQGEAQMLGEEEFGRKHDAEHEVMTMLVREVGQ